MPTGSDVDDYELVAPTPQAIADIYYLNIMDGESRQTRQQSIVALIEHVRDHPDVKIGELRLSVKVSP